MNAGTMIAVQAAAAAAAAQRNLLDAFRVHGATAPERAQPLDALGVARDDRALARLLDAGVLRAVDSRGRDAVPGDELARVSGFYLDEVAYVAYRDRRPAGRWRQPRVLLVLVVLALILGASLLLMLAQQS